MYTSGKWDPSVAKKLPVGPNGFNCASVAA
jgi:hypothetical protein